MSLNGCLEQLPPRPILLSEELRQTQNRHNDIRIDDEHLWDKKVRFRQGAPKVNPVGPRYPEEDVELFIISWSSYMDNTRRKQEHTESQEDIRISLVHQRQKRQKINDWNDPINPREKKRGSGNIKFTINRNIGWKLLNPDREHALDSNKK